MKKLSPIKYYLFLKRVKNLVFPPFILAVLAMPCASGQSKQQAPLYLAFVLHMHQPVYYPQMPVDWNYFNMPTDAGSNVTVRQVFEDAGFCYRRPATIVNNYSKAKLTIHFTGSLMQQIDFLAENGFYSKGTPLKGIWQDYRAAVKTGRMEMIADGFHHPIFPLIARNDAQLQVEKMRPLYGYYFNTEAEGFFPPEMAFDASIMPWLKDFGFKWSLFDSFHILNLMDKDKWSKEYCQAAFRPHLSEYEGTKFIVIPREHWLGQNQSDGFSAEYLVGQLKQIQKWNTDPAKPFLVVIVTDGENGWMRQAGGGYYDWFWPNFMNALENPENNWLKLATVSEYLENVYVPEDVIQIERGSWGVGGTNIDLSTWEGSDLDKQMWKKINETREKLENMQSSVAPEQMAVAWDYFAMAQTSCYWFWDNKEWAKKSYTALELALKAAESRKKPALPEKNNDSNCLEQLKNIPVFHR